MLLSIHRAAVQAHLVRIGDINPQVLRQLLSECELSHVHTLQCDLSSKLVIHLHNWLEWGPVWIRVDCKDCLRFALPDEDGLMKWWQMPWPSQLKLLFLE